MGKRTGNFVELEVIGDHKNGWSINKVTKTNRELQFEQNRFGILEECEILETLRENKLIKSYENSSDINIIQYDNVIELYRNKDEKPLFHIHLI